MKHIYSIISLLLLSLLTLSCEDEVKDRSLNFIGDSIIARWDLAESFPSWRVYNYGKSGATIGYLESYAGKFAGKQVVVMIGTNDNTMFNPAHVKEYSLRYVDIIEKLGATKIYLFSVLPRDFSVDRDGVNDDIRTFNNLVKEEVAHNPQIIYIDVYNDFISGDKINMQLYNDGLHLSPYGYEVLAKALEEYL